MLYPTLRLIAGTALRWYYREVTVLGAERIPREGPVLLTVNHPNALVDALVVGWVVPRRVRITAKAVLFDHPVLGGFLRTMGVVPLRRASDERARRRAAQGAGAADDPARNAEAFAAIVDALDAGTTVLIFPEGKSHDEPTLAPLKTGPARIALAAREAGRARGLRIVPLGLVFEEKDVVRSRVVAVVGDPIDVERWHPAAGDSPVSALTREIAARLQAVTLTAPTTDALEEVRRLARYVAAILAPAAPRVGEGQSLGDEYVVAARVARGLAALETFPPDARAAAEGARAGVERFATALEAADVAPTDAAISLRRRHGARFVLRELALVLLVGPLALFGRVTHWLPFRLARRLAARDVTARDQPAMRTILLGLTFVLASYAVQGVAVASLLGWGAALGYVVLLPIAADVDLRYTGRMRTARGRMRAYLRLRRDPTLADRLTAERAALAAEIRALDARVRALEAGTVDQP